MVWHIVMVSFDVIKFRILCRVARKNRKICKQREYESISCRSILFFKQNKARDRFSTRRGSRGTAQQYGGKRTLLYREVIWRCFNDFAVRLDQRKTTAQGSNSTCTKNFVQWSNNLNVKNATTTTIALLFWGSSTVRANKSFIRPRR